MSVIFETKILQDNIFFNKKMFAERLVLADSSWYAYIL